MQRRRRCDQLALPARGHHRSCHHDHAPESASSFPCLTSDCAADPERALSDSYRDVATGHLLWKGYQYSFLFLMSVFICVAIIAGIFFRDPTAVAADDESTSTVHAHGAAESAEDKLERAAVA